MFSPKLPLCKINATATECEFKCLRRYRSLQIIIYQKYSHSRKLCTALYWRAYYCIAELFSIFTAKGKCRCIRTIDFALLGGVGEPAERAARRSPFTSFFNRFAHKRRRQCPVKSSRWTVSIQQQTLSWHGGSSTACII